MKIVHIVWGLTNGGIENMLSDIVRYQVNEAEVHLIIINNLIENSIYNRIHQFCIIHKINRPIKSKNPYYLFLLNFLLQRIRPDVIHFHGDMYRYVKCRAKAKIFTAHNLSWGERHVPGMDAYVAISTVVKANLIKNGYKNVVQIDNGIDFSLISERRPRNDGLFKIVQTGRLIIQYKGQDLLICAIEKLVKAGYENLRVDFMGDGESRTLLESMTKEKKLEKYVKFLGDCDRNYIYEHLKDYDAFIQASRWEGFGLTVAEAVAAKLPVVVARHEGPLQIIANGKYGNVFDIEDVDGLVNEIKKINEDYPTEEQLLEAYNYAKANFCIEKTAALYMQTYDAIIQNK